MLQGGILQYCSLEKHYTWTIDSESDAKDITRGIAAFGSEVNRSTTLFFT